MGVSIAEGQGEVSMGFNLYDAGAQTESGKIKEWRDPYQGLETCSFICLEMVYMYTCVK